eukprot:4113349-Karenia_brevis.AAC.1
MMVTHVDSRVMTEKRLRMICLNSLKVMVKTSPIKTEMRPIKTTTPIQTTTQMTATQMTPANTTMTCFLDLPRSIPKTGQC